MKIIHYLHWLAGIILIFLHGFFPNRFIIDNFIILIYFISSIPFIAQFLKEVNIFGAKFKFKKEIRITEELFNMSGTSRIRTEVDASLAVVKSKALDNARKLLDSDPVLALAVLRIEIEKSLKTIAKRLDFPIREKISITEILVHLERKEIFSHDHVLILRQIIKMCNKAIHGVAISKEEAKEIIFLAEKYYRTLENIILVDKTIKIK
jgi:hypothetical protein